MIVQLGCGRVARRSQRAGQALTEYVVLTGLLLGMVLILAIFLYAFKVFGARILDLVSYELP